MMLVIRDVNFDNKIKRNIMDLLHAFYHNVVPNYDEIFPDHAKAIVCEEYLLHEGSREGNQLIVSLAFIWFHSCCCFIPLDGVAVLICSCSFGFACVAGYF